MFKRLFARSGHANRLIADALYAEIVAAARQPVPYSDWGVPDTPLGRYEMMALHVFLIVHRLRGEGAPAASLGQELTDTFFTDMDHSLRELGIGDMGIPKRMKRLGRMYLGRASSYGAALDAGDRPALAQALARNIRPDTPDWPQGAALADYVFDASAALARQPLTDILDGRVAFAVPQAHGAQP